MTSGSPLTDQRSRLDDRRRRRTTLGAAKVNGLLWSIGNGLLGSTLVQYVAAELKSPQFGLSIGAILAAPKIVGLLRLAAPSVIGRAAGRKGTAVVAYLASVACLAPLPFAALHPDALAPVAMLWSVVGAWCLYHVCEYFGTVALLSCCAEAAPARVRGRFWGRRERWMLTGNLTAMLAGAAFNAHIGPAWQFSRGESLAATCAAGMVFFVLAVVPLAWLREPASRKDGTRRNGHGEAGEKPEGLFRSMVAPLADGNFRRWLLTGAWISAANGLTQSAQFFCFSKVLGISFAMRQQLDATMKLGQLAIARPIGAAIDRWGAVRTLATCQTLVACGLLFLIAAASRYDAGDAIPRWLAWIPLLEPAGWLPALAINPTWLLWIAFAGHNVGLPTLTVNLAPRGRSAAYLAAYLAWSDLCYAFGTLIGGALLDAYLVEGKVVPGFLTAMLSVGFGLRLAALVGLLRIVDPACSGGAGEAISHVKT